MTVSLIANTILAPSPLLPGSETRKAPLHACQWRYHGPFEWGKGGHICRAGSVGLGIDAIPRRLHAVRRPRGGHVHHWYASTSRVCRDGAHAQLGHHVTHGRTRQSKPLPNRPNPRRLSKYLPNLRPKRRRGRHSHRRRSHRVDTMRAPPARSGGHGPVVPRPVRVDPHRLPGRRGHCSWLCLHVSGVSSEEPGTRARFPSTPAATTQETQAKPTASLLLALMLRAREGVFGV